MDKQDNTTEQFNIRLPKSLIYDLDFISRVTKLQKGDWVRYKLSELVRQTREELLIDLEKSFVRGTLLPDDFKEIVGVSASPELVARSAAYHKKMMSALNDPISRSIAKKTLQGMLHKDAIKQIKKAQSKS